MNRIMTERIVWTMVTSAVLVVIVLWIGRRFSRWLIARVFKRIEDRARRTHCVCGYPLAKLDVPRCPECGRVIGFNATAEELGLTNEELQRAQLAKKARQNNSQT